MKTHPDDAVVGNKTIETGALTKREYFAVIALQGILANSDNRRFLTLTTTIEMSVRHADLLIEELNKEVENET